MSSIDSSLPPGRGRRRAAATLVPFLLALAFSGLNAANAPVADAAATGNREVVRQLLREGVDVNEPQGDGMTALHWAADRGDAELAEILLYAGASVESGTRIGRYTPLHLASRKAHLEVVKALLKAHAKPNAVTTNSGVTPLHLAAAAGSPEVISALLEAGADVHAREASWGQTPLVFAAARNRAEAIRMLIAAGADPASTTQVVDTSVQEEADKAAERRIVEFLADFREKEGGGVDWKPTPSQVQAAIEASREIQRKWPNVPKPGAGQGRGGNRPPEGEGSPPAARPGRPAAAAEEGKPAAGAKPAKDEIRAEGPAPAPVPDVPAQPLKYDADGNPVGNIPKAAGDEQATPLTYGQMVGAWGGLTPLLHAVRQGHVEASLALLEEGADINQPSAGDQTTPLLMAAINGQFDLALELLKRGADPNRASTVGTTPLFAVLERVWAPKASYSHPTEHQQQRTSYLDLMEALLQAGADPNVRLKEHLWYMEYTFGVLRGSGIYLKGATPFWRAANALDVDAMRLLKSHGADPDIPTVKPPERRRRRPQAEEEAKPEPAGKTEKAPGQEGQEKPAESADAGAGQPAKKKVEAPQEEGPGEVDPDDDPSGVPPVPVGGPAIYPIHAASGVGYGQSFAANAHRHAPDSWLAAVQFLVEECGADVNLRDANAYTPLHHAASRGDNEMILYLVEKGADVTVVSRRGQTTADMANGPIQRVSPYPKTIALLEKLGSKNNHKCVSC